MGWPDIVGIGEAGAVLERNMANYVRIGSARGQGLGTGRDGTAQEQGPGSGRGLLVYAHQSIASHTCKVQEDSHCLWVRVDGRDTALYVCCAYFNPASSVQWTTDGAAQLAFEQLKLDILKYRALGNVLVMGDFNARTGSLDDRGTEADELLARLGTAVPTVSSTPGIPARASQDGSTVDAFGRMLISEVAIEGGCILLNGRLQEPGAPTCLRQQHGSVTSSTMIDYALVDARLYQHVRGFRVLPWEPSFSDHCMLMAELPRHLPPVVAPCAGQCYVAQCPKWRPERREQYIHAIGQRMHLLHATLDAMERGEMTAAAAADSCAANILQAAEEAFGPPGAGDNRVLPSGRQPKRWFRHCKQEYQELQAAMARGDTHAARELRKKFNYAKRRWKKHYSRAWHMRLLHDLRFNPRRFWTAYRGARRTALNHSLEQMERYWKQLFGGPGQGDLREAFGDLPEIMSALDTIAQQNPEQRQAAEVLNASFTEEEMRRAIQRLKWGRAAGPDGMTADLLKGAYEVVPGVQPYDKHVYVLQPFLRRLCTGVLTSGQCPPSWAEACLTAVHKKDDPADLDNYRGIAVGNAMGKLYANLIEGRLSAFAETHGLRAKGQAGFRPGRRTTDNVFILRHLIDKYRQGYGVNRRSSLYTCYVDFRKAYDSLHRDLLVQRLARAGLHGHVLSSIASMYLNAPLRARAGSLLSAPFQSTSGVRQGDPLSPLLFGMFIDEVEHWLREHAPEAGVMLGQRKLQDLLYADDIVLLASSPSQLQQLLDALHAFCQDRGMTVNLSKTEIVVYASQRRRRAASEASWFYGGQQVPQSDTFKYLGIWLHQQGGVGDALDPLRLAGVRAMWAMRSQLQTLELNDIYMQQHLFKSLVAPVLSYGCEVWGPDLLSDCSGPECVLNNGLHRVQTNFLRHHGRVRVSTPVAVLYKEFACEPVAKHWFKSVVNFWNRVARMSGDEWVYQAMKESILMHQQHAAGDEHNGWAARVMSMLRSLGDSATADTIAHVAGTRLRAPHTVIDIPLLNLDSLLARWNTMWTAMWEGLPDHQSPRSLPVSDSRIKLVTYNAWMGIDGQAEQALGMPGPVDRDAWYPNGMPQYVRYTHTCAEEHVKHLIRFRCGSHALGIETGRWHGIARQNRLCTKCPARLIDDEYHMVMECSALHSVRDDYSDLFEVVGGHSHAHRASTQQMRVFMNQRPARVAAFIHACEHRRADLPDVQYPELLGLVHALPTFSTTSADTMD
jgi:endonuclease/exonuclease/phosphatase family metal-dependent hydrolase